MVETLRFVDDDGEFAPAVLVARIPAAKYEPPVPAPATPKAGGSRRGGGPKPLIDIQEGILGGRKVVR